MQIICNDADGCNFVGTKIINIPMALAHWSQCLQIRITAWLKALKPAALGPSVCQLSVFYTYELMSRSVLIMKLKMV